MEKSQNEVYGITIKEIMEKFKITGNVVDIRLSSLLEWDRKKNRLVIEVSR